MEENMDEEIGKAFGSAIDDTNENMKEEDEEERGKHSRSPVIVFQTLNYLNNDRGIVFGDQASLEDVTFGSGGREEAPAESDSAENDASCKKCMMEDEKQLSDWLAEHYEDFEMAFLIALAVFDRLPCMWVYEMAEDLFGMMEGDKEEANRDKIRLPHQKRVEMIGARTYKHYIYNHTGRVKEEFVCFQSAKYAPRVLECVWNEFRYFREQMTCWLEKYISKENYSKTIRAIQALSVLLQHDFNYIERKAISPLLDRKDYIADFAVAQIMLQTHENEQYKDNVEKLYLHWAKQGKIHVSLITLMMSVAKRWPQDKVRPAIENYLEIVLLSWEKGLERTYEYHLSLFYAIGDRKALYFKAIVNVLYDKFMQYHSRKDKNRQKMVGMIFWILIKIDDRESNIDVNRQEKHRDMIFVKMCLMQNEEAPKLRALWKYLWKSRDMHKAMKKFLEDYLYQYGGCREEHVRYLRAFLYSFQDTAAEKEDMEFFLKKISLRNSRTVRTAEKINQRSV